MIKGIFDLFFSIILLIILAPLFVVVGILIKLDSPVPVFFKQKRVGKDNKNFMVYKFRSMSEGTPDGAKEDLGEENSYDLIKMRTKAGIHKVKPGIADYAQIMKTGGEDLATKVECDKYYVEHMSLWLDIKIIIKTAIMRFSSKETF